VFDEPSQIMVESVGELEEVGGKGSLEDGAEACALRLALSRA